MTVYVLVGIVQHDYSLRIEAFDSLDKAEEKKKALIEYDLNIEVYGIKEVDVQ